MKKVLYSVLALAGLFAVSCTKEIDAPNAEAAQENLVPMTLTASYDVATKVTYEGMKTFGWVANDSIKVRLVSGDRENSGWYSFGAKSTAASSEFVGDVPDSFRPEDYAFYPGFKTNDLSPVSSSSTAVRLPITYYLDEVDGKGQPIAPQLDPDNCTKVYVSSANPLQFLPSIGKKQENGSYKFQAAYGVLNIQMTDLDDAACGLKLNGLAQTYMANYLMLDRTDMCYKIGDKFTSDGTTYSVTYLKYWFYPKADHTASIYLPVPVGTLPAGCSIDIVDEKGTVLYTQPFSKDVEVQRGKITTLAPFKAKYDWKEVGTGRFFDKKYVAASGLAEGKDVEVKIMQDVSNPNKYRVVTPYAAYNEAAGYTPSGTVTEPNDLYFTVHKAGDIFSGVTIENDGIITFDKTYMGFIEPSLNKEWYLSHVSVFSKFGEEKFWLHSYVVKKNSDGSPAAIQLAPCYYWANYGAYTSDAQEDGNIYILFPGTTSYSDITASVDYVDLADDTPAQAVANVSVALGSDLSAASIVIAATETEAKAAIDAETNVTKVTASGSYQVKLPADAPSGKYYVYAKVTAVDGISTLANRMVVSKKSFTYERKGDWVLVGTGKYIDNYYLEEGGFPAETTIDVEIYQHAVNKNQFRIPAPYATYNTAVGYVSPSGVTSPTDLSFTVYKKGDTAGAVAITDDDEVVYDPIYMGFFDTSKNFEWYLAHPKYLTSMSTTDAKWKYNYVMKYQDNGLPAVVQLAPLYYWDGWGCYTADASTDNRIQILFPGVTEFIDASASVAYADMAETDPAQASALVDVMFGSAVSGVDVVIAQNATDAAKAYSEGTHVAQVNAPGQATVLLPADAPSGDYYVYGIIRGAEGTTSLVSKSFTSSKSFKYLRSDESKGIKVEDVVGDYSGTGYVYYNGWNGGQTISMTIAANTEDPTLGDIKITYFANSYVSVFGTIDTQIYGWLDGDKGIVSIDPLQPTHTFDDGSMVILGAGGDSNPKTDPILFYVSDDKKSLTAGGFFGYYRYVPAQDKILYYNVYFSPTDVPLSLTKVVSSSSAPARLMKDQNRVEVTSSSSTRVNVNFDSKAANMLK